MKKQKKAKLDMLALIWMLYDGLYVPFVVESIQQLALQYIDQEEAAGKVAVPPSLADLVGLRQMPNPVRPVDRFSGYDKELWKHLGVIADGKIHGPLNSIFTRLLLAPKVMASYLGSYGIVPDAHRAAYTDPPVLGLSYDKLNAAYTEHFQECAHEMADTSVALSNLALLGLLGQLVADNFEPIYPGRTSTQAYELFGIFHLFHGNSTVRITSTSPGIVIPSEANPMMYPSEKVGTPFRPFYFDMLRLSVGIGIPRVRRLYFASREGTQNGLAGLKSSEIAVARTILGQYTGLGNKFQIRTGIPDPRMATATFAGTCGVVLSVRDPDEKKIVHNLTVTGTRGMLLSKRFSKVFAAQWKAAEPFTVETIDKLRQFIA